MQILVSAGVPVTQGDKNRLTPIHLACFSGHHLAVGGMLDSLQPAQVRAAINAKDSGGRTPTHYAAFKGRDEMLEELLRNDGIEFDTSASRMPASAPPRNASPPRRPLTRVGRFAGDAQGRTPLDTACFMGHAVCADTLMERRANYDNTDDATQRTPLMAACMMGQAQVVELLLDDEFDTDTQKQDASGRTALMMAAELGNTEPVEMLLSGELPEEELVDAQGRTAVHFAVKNGHNEVIEMIVSMMEAKLDRPDVHGRTPAHIAAIYGRDESLRGLVASVQANATCSRGHTPLHYACYHGSDPCVSALLDEEVEYAAEREHPFGPLHCAAARGHASCLETVFEEASDSVEVDGLAAGRTALHLAAAAGHEECVETLLRAGSNVDLLDGEGRTALMLAAAAGHAAAAAVLLEGQADAATAAADGTSAVHLAFGEGSNADCANVLVAAVTEASVNATDGLGRTALHLAMRNHNPTAVEALLAASADKTLKDASGGSAASPLPLVCLLLPVPQSRCATMPITRVVADAMRCDAMRLPATRRVMLVHCCIVAHL